MRFSLWAWLGDDSKSSWEWFGSNDPYYGVLSGDEYRKGNLSDERIKNFFSSGAAHVDNVARTVEAHFGGLRTKNCLDFGCGVGRLVIPFAGRFEYVTGVDVAPSMVREAQLNCEKFGVRNVDFVSSLRDVREQFDLVNSYIVLQHIPVSQGFTEMDAMVEKARPGGICFFHFTIGRNAGVVRKMGTFFRKNFKPIHYFLNLVEGKQANEAYMQSTEYSLNKFIARLFGKRIREFWIESENHGGRYSVSVTFRVPEIY